MLLTTAACEGTATDDRAAAGDPLAVEGESTADLESLLEKIDRGEPIPATESDTALRLAQVVRARKRTEAIADRAITESDRAIAVAERAVQHAEASRELSADVADHLSEVQTAAETVAGTSEPSAVAEATTIVGENAAQGRVLSKRAAVLAEEATAEAKQAERIADISLAQAKSAAAAVEATEIAAEESEIEVAVGEVEAARLAQIQALRAAEAAGDAARNAAEAARVARDAAQQAVEDAQLAAQVAAGAGVDPGTAAASGVPLGTEPNATAATDPDLAAIAPSLGKNEAELETSDEEIALSLRFPGGEAVLSEEEQQKLENFVKRQWDEPKRTVDIRAYWIGGGDERTESLRRGVLVRSFLKNRGITWTRLSLRQLAPDAEDADRVDLFFDGS